MFFVLFQYHAANAYPSIPNKEISSLEKQWAGQLCRLTTLACNAGYSKCVGNMKK